MPTAFIIHGHDLDARNALDAFLTDLGLTVLPFHRAATANNTVLETVVAGIGNADVVFVLFTPDEQAHYHDPRTGTYRERDKNHELLAGWQPRPNVVLEAGFALGVARRKTAFLRLGPVRRISDLDGKRYINLDDESAVDEIIQFLQEVVPSFTPKSPWPRLDGVRKHERHRWASYSELAELESELGNLLSGETTFLKVIKDYVAAKREDEWDSTDLVDYFFYNVDPYPYDKQATATDGFFWNLLILGVISYPSIDNGWDRAARWWVKQQRFVELTARGKALLRKLHAMHATSTN